MTSLVHARDHANMHQGRRALPIPAQTLIEMDRSRFVPVLDAAGQPVYIPRAALPKRNATCRFRSFMRTATAWLDMAYGISVSDSDGTGDIPSHGNKTPLADKLFFARAALNNAERCFADFALPDWAAEMLATERARLDAKRSRCNVVARACQEWAERGRADRAAKWNAWMERAVERVRAQRAKAQRPALDPEVAAWAAACSAAVAFVPSAPGVRFQRLSLVAA